MEYSIFLYHTYVFHTITHTHTQTHTPIRVHQLTTWLSMCANTETEHNFTQPNHTPIQKYVSLPTTTTHKTPLHTSIEHIYYTFLIRCVCVRGSDCPTMMIIIMYTPNIDRFFITLRPFRRSIIVHVLWALFSDCFCWFMVRVVIVCVRVCRVPGYISVAKVFMYVYFTCSCINACLHTRQIT